MNYRMRMYIVYLVVYSLPRLVCAVVLLSLYIFYYYMDLIYFFNHSLILDIYDNVTGTRNVVIKYKRILQYSIYYRVQVARL